MNSESKAERIKKFKEKIRKAQDPFIDKENGILYSKTHEFNEKVLKLKIFEKKYEELQKQQLSEFFKNNFEIIKKDLKDTSKVDFVMKEYDNLKRRIIIYQNNRIELAVLHEKLNNILERIGHDSCAELIREQILELKKLKYSPEIILHTLTRINSEIPELNNKVNIYQNNRLELTELYEKLNYILEQIGHDSCAERIREHIYELKQLEVNQKTISQVITRINSEIPGINKEFNIYQNNRLELTELYEKLNYILGQIGHDSCAERIREHIYELKQLEVNQKTISQVITRIKSEIPGINNEISVYTQKLNELKQYKKRLNNLKSEKYQIKINELLKKSDSIDNHDSIKHQIPLLEHEIFLDRIIISKQKYPNIYLEDIIEEGEKLKKNMDEYLLEKIENKFNDREKLENEKNVLQNKVRILQQKYNKCSDDCNITDKSYNIFENIIEKLFYEIKTEKDLEKIVIVKKNLFKLGFYLTTLEGFINRYKKLEKYCNEMGVEKNCCVFLNEIQSNIKMFLTQKNYDFKIKRIFKEIKKIIEEGEYFIKISKDVKLDIGKLQNSYVEFVEKFKINDMWEKAVSKSDNYLMSKIKDILDEGNEIKINYLELKRKLKLVKGLLYPNCPLDKKMKIKKIEQKLEKGKREIKKDVFYEVEVEIKELMPPPMPDRGFGRRHPINPGWNPDWDSPAEH
jgi:hypothetical protein